MKLTASRIGFTSVTLLTFGMLTAFVWAAPGNGNQFTNIGSIANTRHNMTQSTAANGIAIYMNGYRNNYGEVCVYCHTPHGAQKLVRMPLWNRTIKATTYSTYDQLGTSTLKGVVSQPGNNSLTCLSCHDGQTAIDSIINMPGSGTGNNTGDAATTQNTAFLNSWPGGPTVHMGLASSNGATGEGCLSCHSLTGSAHWGPTGFAPDFSLFLIGTDLRNDHPVGITFPVYTGANTDWNTPAGTTGTSIYFENNNNGHMDTDEIRIYNGQVECASCHDPHGVPASGVGSTFKPTFLRVANTGSAVCLTCHNK